MLEHGIGRHCVGCHVDCSKIALTSLERAVGVVSGFVRVGAESDQQVHIYSFAVRCDQRWPSTQ